MSSPIKPASPLPWEKVGSYVCKIDSIVVADCSLVNMSDECISENAAYIVTACNEFPALVEAVEFLMDIDPASGEVVTVEKYQELQDLLARCQGGC